VSITETLYSPKQEICRKSKKFSNVGLVPDLTKEQSKDEDEMIKEVEKLNDQLKLKFKILKSRNPYLSIIIQR